jgi:hypothetical protein
VAAAALAPKETTGSEQTGSYRRPGVPWGKGQGQGAKVIALRPTAPHEPAGERPEPPARHASAVEDTTESVSRVTGDRAPAQASDRASKAPTANTAGTGSRLATTASGADTTASGAATTASGAATTPHPRPDSTGSHLTTTGSGAAVRRPPVLASESLREYLTPAEPGRRQMRVAAAVLGMGGAAAVLALGGAAPVPLVGAAGLVLVAAAGVAPLRYRDRAAIVLTLSLPLLLLNVLSEASSTGAARHGVLLGLGVSGLAGALFFRAEHRASKVARALVGVGIATCIAWIAVSGMLGSTVVTSWQWQAWLPAALALSLVTLLCLSLLAFMAPNSGGGCRTWASSLLGWYALALGTWVAGAAWPGGGLEGAGPAAVRGGAMSAVGAAVTAALVALAMSQVLASVSARPRTPTRP